MPQPVFEDEQYLRVRYDRVPASQSALIATVLIHHPPVNALSSRVLEALARAFEHLEHHEEVRAVVLSARATTSFSAGADIRELLGGLNEPTEARALVAKAHALLAGIEAMDKPVVAAIDGPALGGGCELAMACHFRIGNARTRMGQPEINLFLPPAFGGTQRLPRLVEAALAEPLTSLPIALGWLLCGRLIRADIAKDGGLLDEVVTGSTDVLSRARLLAAQCARGTQNPVAETRAFRRQQRAQWDTPDALDWSEIEQDPYLQQCLAQARHVGRGRVAETIVELVRTGLEEGIETGLAAEADAFTRFVLDPEHGGKKGIRLFLDKRSPALPLRRRPQFSAAELKRLEDEYWLLPIGSPFIPGVTPLPQMQYAWSVVKNPATGEPEHGPPKEQETEIILEVPRPKPNEALLYVLASELNRTDVSTITGLPSSVFDLHDEDEHVTGSGGLGLIAELGEAVQAEGRLQVGELVVIYPGRRELLDPRDGEEPMMSRFIHQGYETPDGTHQQFMLVQGPQCLPLPAGVPLEAAGSFLVAAGTAYRGLINALEIQPGKRVLVEDAGCDADRWTVKLGLTLGVKATSLTPNEAHATAMRELGAGAINREAKGLADCFTPIPADPGHWGEWQTRGETWLAAVRTANDRTLVDYAVSHADAPGFARSFQALAEGGTLALQSTAENEVMAFLGKPGKADPADMLQRAGLRPCETVVIYYGMTGEEDDDATGQKLLAAAQAARARLAVITRTQAQRERVHALELGDALVGILSIEALEQRAPKFLWGKTPQGLPDSRTDSTNGKAARREFIQRTLSPLAEALGQLLRQSNCPSGAPDLIIERARQDTLALSTLLVRPHTGRIVYCEEMAQQRYSFYALSISKDQRRILMPSARIVGTHLCSAAEAEAVRRLIETGIIEVPAVHLFDWRECPMAHQAIWENRLASATGGTDKAMLNHALPGAGLKNTDELAVRWSSQKMQRGR